MTMEYTCSLDKQTEGGDRRLRLESLMYQNPMRHNEVLQSNTSEADVNHLAGSAAGHALLVVS